MKKKVLAFTVALAAALTCAVAFSACGSSAKETYYGKALTLTDAAAPVIWDKKCERDNGPDNSVPFDDPNYDKKNYSYNQLLEKYWDRIDFSYYSEGPNMNLIANKSFQNYAEFTAHIDANLNEVFKSEKGLKFVFSEKSDNMTMTILPATGESTVYRIVETQAQFNAISSNIDERCAQIFSSTYLLNNPGYSCLGLLDTNGDNLYDSYCTFYTTNYVVNGNVRTLSLETYMLDWSISFQDDTLSGGTQDIYRSAGTSEKSVLLLWEQEKEITVVDETTGESVTNTSRSSIISIGLYPAYTLEKTLS